MYNFYVPPGKILFFLLLLCGTTFAAYSLRRSDVIVPKLHFEIVEEKDVIRPEIPWSTIPIKTNGADRNYGNIVSIQAYLRVEDFAKAEWWSERIEELLKAGKLANIYNRKTIIIFPEHIGSGLVFLNEKNDIFESENWQSALEKYGRKSESDLRPLIANSKKSQATLEAVFRLKSKDMLDVYQQTFSRLAKEYNVPILAGSIILPSPKVVNGILVIDPLGPLYNVSVPFSADGKVMNPLIRKTMLAKEESSILEPGEINQDRTWIVPGWKVGIFIGQEVFNQTLYTKLSGKPLDGLVSPSASFQELDVEILKTFIADPDFMNLSQNEIWEKYGLQKHIKNTRAVDFIQVFMHGNLFGLKTKGRTFNVRDFLNFDSADSDAEPNILNLYF